MKSDRKETLKINLKTDLTFEFKALLLILENWQRSNVKSFFQ